VEFISEFGFDIKQGQFGAFAEWLNANEEKMAASAPEGWEYIGTYAVVLTSEKNAGAARQLWRHHDYAAMDTWAAVMREGGTFAELQDGLSAFVDQDRAAGWSQTTLKAVRDTSFWGEE
jgi:hypothetical protein